MAPVGNGLGAGLLELVQPHVVLLADTARRVCHIRLESPEENPENRSDLRHPNLEAYIRRRRGELLAAALTILVGYIRNGRPDQDLPAWGSFEGWSGLVRSAVVWAGLPDPAATRHELAEQADVTASHLGLLLDA